jgi:hypothetical protein
MWVNSDHPIIRKIYHILPLGYFKDEGRCEMLITEDGKTTCLIEQILGKEHKPEYCNEYPENGKKCMGAK